MFYFLNTEAARHVDQDYCKEIREIYFGGDVLLQTNNQNTVCEITVTAGFLHPF